jgi:hypothetical protein
VGEKERPENTRTAGARESGRCRAPGRDTLEADTARALARAVERSRAEGG